jgi:hypothetical protein
MIKNSFARRPFEKVFGSDTSFMQPKTFRRGETIFKAGDPITDLYIVQSGVASVGVHRAGKTIEIVQVGIGQLLGEEALWGRQQWGANAVANNDIKAMPIAAKEAIAMLSSGSSLIQIFLKGLVEKERTWWSTLLSIRGEADPTPCPPEKITQLFAVLYQAASYTGTHKKGATVVVWPAFKKYCQRVFLESPVRLEQAVNILVKLGAAKLEMIPCETDPEAPDELGFVHFTDLERVKRFYEFYRALTFTKSGKGRAAPKPDDSSLEILKEIEAWNRVGKVVVVA